MKRLIAIHLPQFHPFPENDVWWGKGFTEWTNVAKAEPLFKEHYQPHIPADLGFYDLRLEEAREAQAALAREHGVYGFCYYHYWFGGNRLMRRTIDPMIASGKPNFPFMFCWANETWSRNWLGEENSVLIRQEYSPEDDERHAEYLAEIFTDKRYITISGRPVFAIYRPNDLPDAARTLATIRRAAERRGLKAPYFIATNSRRVHHPEQFDGILNFEPQLGLLPHAFKDGFVLKRLWRNYRRFNVFNGTHRLYDYDAVKRMLAKRPLTEKTFPCVFVGWDNTPRRGTRGVIIHNQNEAAFRQSLEGAIDAVVNRPPDEQVVFINAWNEWAEGNHLEPCQRYGTAYLEVVKSVVQHQPSLVKEDLT